MPYASNRNPLRPVVRYGMAAVAALAATPALAHPGHGGAHGVLAGLAHPLTGIDHLAAIFGIGVLSVAADQKMQWDIALCFLASMAAGAVLGLGNPLAAVETGVAVSVLCVGVCVLVLHRRLRHHALPLAAITGLLHGWAHGAGVPANSSGLLFIGGALAATLLLAGLGAWASMRLAGSVAARGIAGGAIILAGFGALVG